MTEQIITGLIAAGIAILSTIAGVVGKKIDSYYERMANTAEKKRIVKECVAMVEQLYNDLHGEEKKRRAADAIVERFEQAGLAYTILELEHMIEAAVAKFNDAFAKKTK